MEILSRNDQDQLLVKPASWPDEVGRDLAVLVTAPESGIITDPNNEDEKGQALEYALLHLAWNTDGYVHPLRVGKKLSECTRVVRKPGQAEFAAVMKVPTSMILRPAELVQANIRPKPGVLYLRVPGSDDTLQGGFSLEKFSRWLESRHGADTAADQIKRGYIAMWELILGGTEVPGLTLKTGERVLEVALDLDTARYLGATRLLLNVVRRIGLGPAVIGLSGKPAHRLDPERGTPQAIDPAAPVEEEESPLDESDVAFGWFVNFLLISQVIGGDLRTFVANGIREMFDNIFPFSEWLEHVLAEVAQRRQGLIVDHRDSTPDDTSV